MGSYLKSFKVVFRDMRTYLYTLLVRFLLAILLFALRSLVFMSAVIRNSDNRGLCVAGNQHKVEPLFSGLVERLARLHNSDLRAILPYNAYVAEAQKSFVDIWARISLGAWSKSPYCRSPRC